jgi:hypothetical protein
MKRASCQSGIGMLGAIRFKFEAVQPGNGIGYKRLQYWKKQIKVSAPLERLFAGWKSLLVDH